MLFIVAVEDLREVRKVLRRIERCGNVRFVKALILVDGKPSYVGNLVRRTSAKARKVDTIVIV